MDVNVKVKRIQFKVAGEQERMGRIGEVDLISFLQVFTELLDSWNHVLWNWFK